MSIRVMIVDDSLFSRAVLADSLQQEGYEVVGEADSLETLFATYDQCNPDIITMDIAMPGADGFECSRALLRHDPKAKIIMVSSMKDEDSEAEARRVGIAGYLQKPVDGEMLTKMIAEVLAPDTLFAGLQGWCIDSFQEALSATITRMTQAAATFAAAEWADINISRGITVVVGIIGRYPGSMIVDFSYQSAEKMAEVILRRKARGPEEVLAMGAEFANIIGGIACSLLNKREKALSLRVSPPSVFVGAQTEIVSPSVDLKGLYADSTFGRIYLGVGFKKGTVLWM